MPHGLTDSKDLKPDFVGRHWGENRNWKHDLPDFRGILQMGTIRKLLRGEDIGRDRGAGQRGRCLHRFDRILRPVR